MRIKEHADAGLGRIWMAADQTQKRKSDGGGSGDKSDKAGGDAGQKKIAKKGGR